MPVTVGGTSITFNDATVQTTAAGAIPANLAVGSIAVLYNFARTGLIQGSNVNTAQVGYATSSPIGSGTSGFTNTARVGNVVTAGAGVFNIYPNTATPTGTWRALSSASPSIYNGCCNNNITYAPPFLAVRIA